MYAIRSYYVERVLSCRFSGGTTGGDIPLVQCSGRQQQIQVGQGMVIAGVLGQLHRFLDQGRCPINARKIKGEVIQPMG